MSTSLPKTDSIQELASFWDSHSLTDFEDELEEVREPVFVKAADQITIQLSSTELEAAQRIARDKGQNLGTLFHAWVTEKLYAS